jgi:hypothetical protein
VWHWLYGMPIVTMVELLVAFAAADGTKYAQIITAATP